MHPSSVYAAVRRGMSQAGPMPDAREACRLFLDASVGPLVEVSNAGGAAIVRFTQPSGSGRTPSAEAQLHRTACNWQQMVV